MKHRRRLKILTAIVAAMCLAAPCSAKSESAPDTENIVLHERYTENAEGFYIENNTAFMPVRSLAAMCLDSPYVAWNPALRTAYVSSENADLAVTDLEKEAQSMGETSRLSSAPRVKNGTMYVPVRDTAELLGYSAEWDAADRSITLLKDTPDDSDSTLFWLSRIIFAEARGEPFEGKLAVGNVVLERAASDEFPDTVYGVIFDRDPVVQFTPLSNFTLFNIPDEECIDAAKRVLSGEKAVDGCLYFVNPVTTSSDWVMKNREFVTMIGNHAFYK